MGRAVRGLDVLGLVGNRGSDARMLLVSLSLAAMAIIMLMLSACSADLPQSATCPPSTEVTFPASISRMTTLAMPLGQFLGRTRQDNETLLTPQSVQPLTGWVTYGPGFSIRYQARRAVAIKATLDSGAPWQEISAWAGFQPAVAPLCRGPVCRWEAGQLCYGSQPLAATWNSETAELHVWQPQGATNGWLLAGCVLGAVLLSRALLRSLRPGRKSKSNDET